MREVSDATFESDVLHADRPVAVDFWAPWCGPCYAVEPVLAQLASRAAGSVEFVKLNVDQNPAAPSRYGVLALPTVILFAGGEPRQPVVGPRPAAYYERAWAEWLTPAV